MVIRFMTFDDIPHLINIFRIMHAESQYAGLPFSVEKVAMAIVKFVSMEEQALALVAEDDGMPVGVFIASITEMVYSTAKVAEEQVFYILPSKRGSFCAFRMIKSFLKWAKSHKVDMMLMMSAAGIKENRASSLYERFGFKQVGAQYCLREV